MNETIWIASGPSNEAHLLSDTMGIPLPIAQVLTNRGITGEREAQRFLSGSLEDMEDPFLMKGMESAVSRINEAVRSGEKILIFGDYDVDGILSIITLMKALRTLGAKVEHFIPNRLTEGYGIKSHHIQTVLEKGARLVISVDCGIKAVEFAKAAKKNGIDFIVTDHHRPGADLPEAVSVLNPQVDDSGYPDKYLAGIGVVFKLIQALFQNRKEASLLHHYLKLVSIATVADVVMLRGENRIFVKFGLKGLQKISNTGLRYLLESCRLSGKGISVADVGFKIGPRINAAGRLGKADLAVELFLSENPQECRDLVRQLEVLNSRRQRIEEKILDQAVKRIEDRSLDKKYKILVLGCEEWERGVIGIVASKLKDLYYRPVLLFTYKNGKAYGSGRSISEFSLIECLNNNRDHLFNYGGHTLAVGCELARQDIPAFKSDINRFAEEALTKEDLIRKIKIDAFLEFDTIDSSFLEKLSLLSPFGMGNPKPVFCTENVGMVSLPQKLKGKHTKLFVSSQGRTFEALGWGRADWADSIKREDRIDLAYSLQTSEYLGEKRTNLIIEDLKKTR